MTKPSTIDETIAHALGLVYKDHPDAILAIRFLVDKGYTADILRMNDRLNHLR